MIENTAGQGTNVGSRFEHLRTIIDLVDDKSRIGVCIDTAHAFAAGYNLIGEKRLPKHSLRLTLLSVSIICAECTSTTQKI